MTSQRKEDNGKVLVSEGAENELKRGIEALDRTETSQFFYTIRRRRPGEPLLPIWKRHIAIADIPDVEDFCFNSADGGPGFDYRVSIVDFKGRPAKIRGQEIPDRDLPARDPLAAPPPPLPPNLKGQPFAQDPLLLEKEQQLYRQKRELELKRQEVALERERRKFEKKVENGDDDDDDGDDYRYPQQSRYRFYPPGYGPGWQGAPSPWMAGQTPPWMQQRQAQPDANTQILIELIRAQSAKPATDPMQMLQVMMPFLVSGKFEPAEMFKMMGPIMASSMSAVTEAQKIAMQSQADNDRMLKEKMIDLLELNGADPDDLDRYRKIMGMVTDGLGTVAKIIFRGGGDGAKDGNKIQVPRIGGQPERLPGPAAPRPPVPPGSPPPKPNPNPPAKSPEEAAQEVVRQRVSVLVQAHEQEMHIGGDPATIAEKFDEIYLALPEDLRKKLEEVDVAAVYDTLRSFDTEAIDRILAAVAADASGRKKEWCRAFWDELLHPEDEDDDGEDDSGDGEEPGPEGGGETVREEEETRLPEAP